MKEKKHINPRKVSAMKDFACVLPVLIFLAVFTYYPIAELFRISFTDWNMLNDTWHYVGFKNWKWLFGGSGTKYLWNSLKVTILYSAGEIFITLVGGMIFALIFNRMTKGFSAMRAIVFMPKYVAMSSAAVVFLWILNTDGGILNYLLSLVGISKVDWLGNPPHRPAFGPDADRMAVRGIWNDGVFVCHDGHFHGLLRSGLPGWGQCDTAVL